MLSRLKAEAPVENESASGPNGVATGSLPPDGGGEVVVDRSRVRGCRQDDREQDCARLQAGNDEKSSSLHGSMKCDHAKWK